jgi:hypothetical protein
MFARVFRLTVCLTRATAGLGAELAKDPEGDTRSAFYLAQTLELVGKYEEAYEMNLRRDKMGWFASVAH